MQMEVDNAVLIINPVGSKAKALQEIYRILTTEGGVYLPPSQEWNYNFIRDIITGGKRVGKYN